MRVIVIYWALYSSDLGSWDPGVCLQVTSEGLGVYVSFKKKKHHVRKKSNEKFDL